MGVLVVEDSEPVGKMLVQLLERAGFEARWTGSATEAVAWAKDWAPSVVLLDLHLADGDGLEVAKKLRKDPATKASRLIGLSGDPLPKAKQRNLDGFLLKPVALAAVLDAVRG
jgi:CheY-like chemotaxis protein